MGLGGGLIRSVGLMGFGGLMESEGLMGSAGLMAE